jgi:hypothetical protein
VGERENISVYEPVFLTAKITLEFYKKSDPKNLQVSYLGKRSGKNRWLIGSLLLEWGCLGLGNRILRRKE